MLPSMRSTSGFIDPVGSMKQNAQGLAQFHSQSCQRRLQPMRQIGDVPPCGSEPLRILLDQRVEFLDQRPQFVRLIRRYMLRPAGADFAQARLQMPKRAQAEPHLQEAREQQSDADRDQRPQQRHQRLLHRTEQRLSRRRDQEGDGLAGGGHRPRAQMQALAARSRPLRRAAPAREQLAPLETVRRNIDGTIAERFRPQVHAVAARLPIPAGGKSIEGRAIDIHRQDQLPLAVSLQRIGDGDHLAVQPLVELVGHELLQDEADQDCGSHQRQGDEDGGAGQEPPAQRGR
jgi:hypothetical protein